MAPEPPPHFLFKNYYFSFYCEKDARIAQHISARLPSQCDSRWHVGVFLLLSYVRSLARHTSILAETFQSKL